MVSLGDETARYLLSLVQPSPCHLSPLTCAIPPGDKPTQGHSDRDSPPMCTSRGGFGTHDALKTLWEEGTGGDRGADGSEHLEVSPYR